MELASGHTVHLQPERSAPAVVLRLPQALRQAIAAAQQNGEQVALRCSQVGNICQATLSVGNLQHHFTGVPVEKQTVLRLSTLDDVDGAVVANIGCKLHKQKALHTSDIGSRIRASAQAEKQGRGQTQVLDRVPPSNGHSKGHRSLTPPAGAHRPAAVQPRPKTPPPIMERSSASAAAAAPGSNRPQAQAARLAGRSLTPPNSRPTTPPPAKQQQQVAGNVPQQQQQPRPHSKPKPLSKDPPKPRSLASSKQQQRRTPPPANLQQQGQRPATAGIRVGTPSTAASAAVQGGGPSSHNTAPSTAAAAAAPRISPAPSATPAVPGVVSAAGGSAVQSKATSARPSAAGGSTAAGADKVTGQRGTAGGSRSGSRGVSPALGSSAAIAAKQQQMRSAMPLISVQPLPQAPKSAGDRRSPAPTTAAQQQQQQQPQRSRLQQGSSGNRATAAASANAGSGSKSAGPVAVTRTSAAPSQQQQQQAKKRPGPSNEVAGNISGVAGKAAKMRRLNELGGAKASLLPAAPGAGGTTSQPGMRKPAAKQQQQTARQPQRRGASPSLPAVGGQRLSPDGSFSSAGASPSQQQQHTKHWFTSSDESGEVCSVGDEPAAGSGRAAAAATASNKRKRELNSAVGSIQPSVAAAAPATNTSTAQQSWAAAIQAKKKQHVIIQAMLEPAAAGRPRTTIDPAAAKSSWQAALKRQSPQDQATPTVAPAQQQQQPPVSVAAQSGSNKRLRAPAAAKAAQPVDLGPPGYGAFVDRGPRSFSPISSQQEYLQYIAMYEAQYPMYLTLSNIIDTNIRYVKEAHARMAAQTMGSSGYLEAKQQLQQQLTSKGELTRRWNAALVTLHTELCALKARMQQWVHCRRAEAAKTAAAPAVAELQSTGDTTWNPVQDLQQRQCLGGKGFMLAAAHGVQHAAVVGA